MFLNIVYNSSVFCSLLCLVRFLSDSDRDCLEAACIPANLNSAVECSRSRGESASTKTLLLRMPHAWAPCSQWHTGLPFSSSVACFKTPVQCHECAKCRCQCFLLHVRKGRNASAMDIMSVIAFRSKDTFIFTVFLARSLPWIQKVLHQQIQFTMEKRSKMIEYAERCSRGT